MKNDVMRRRAGDVRLSSIIFCVTVLVAWLPARGRAQVNSGSDGSDGAFNPATNVVINMADHPNGIYKYTSVNIPTNVTVTFVANASNTPVYWLVQSNVVINGTVDVHGHGPTGTPYPSYPANTTGGVGGPGGARGGDGGSSPTPGQGPGGGSVPAGAGGFGTPGKSFWGPGAGGAAYGDPSLVPLLGGSGGAGGGAWASGGGGGSGSILIIASGSIKVNGTINATGDLGFYSGGGSGGGVRLVAANLLGGGNIATHGTDPLGYDGGGDGRVRIESLDYSFTGQITGVFTEGSPAPGLSVSVMLSGVVISPNVVPADGQSAATVTVTLLDGNGLPVVGKWVRISAVEQLSSGGVAVLSTVAQPASPTDNNGQATASFTSTAPGTAIISAQDATDGISLRQSTVQFTSGFVSPDPALSNAIVQLGNSTSNLLVNSIATTAVQEGGHGDFFQANVASDNAEQELLALGTLVGSMTPLLEDQGLILETAKSIRNDLTFYAAGEAVDVILESSTGLTMLGQGVASDNGAYEQALLPRQRSTAAGVPPACSQYVADYTNDLALRLQANNAIKTLLSSQNDLLLNLQENSTVSHVDLLTPLFMDINVVGTLAGAALTPLGSVLTAEALNFSESIVSYGANQRNLNKDQNGYNSAMVSLIDCSYFSGLIYSNTASAFDAIAHGRRPNPVTGGLISVDSVKTYEPLSGITGALIDWAGLALANTEYVHVTGAYSLLTIRNTSQQTAAFNLNAFYWHTISINDEVGDVLGSMTTPLVLSVNTNLGAGQSAQVTVNYFDGVNGAAPDDGSVITMTVLGYDGNNGIYAVDQRSSTIQWQPAGNVVPGPIPKPDPGPIGSHDVTNLFGLETPIKSRVILNPSNQTYQAQIWVANPFAIPLAATVTQSLPAGLTVLTTDGVLSGGSIVWSKSIPTNGLVTDSLTFTLAVTPGAQTNLPAATVVFRDATPTNSLTMQSAPAAFMGLLPVQVTGSVPTGIAGQIAGMPMGLTNLTTTSQAGTLMVAVTDLSGNAVTNFSQSFELGSGLGTNLALSLPGTWAPGSYLVTGSLSINGGTEQVLSGMYIVPPAPPTLGYGPASGVLTNGFTLRLQGAAGFGYLIEASTNLVNWQPVQYVVATGSPTYFTDHYAPFYSQRFYRAVPISQVQPPVVPQFGAVRLVSGGGVQLTLTGGVGQTYNVEASTNLVNWVAITNLVLSIGSGQFTDYSVTNWTQRFYRAVVP